MRYIALLRGINVGGHRRVPMKDLRITFEGLGLENVQTYIQSGNVVFGAQETGEAALEAAMARDFGFPVDVMLRTQEEWARLAERNPYPAQAEAGGTKVHVAFLRHVPDEAALIALRARSAGDDTWEHVGRELYLYAPRGLGQSQLSLAPLRQTATVRNWQTVLRLGEMLGA
ncbi:DUF1697 domain-containing protein [Deinococcus hopiensis]|uniref:Uncharacterized conserved protein, DUF1697 family n=1 Tax=Deinococcus hopiensis KR-140 TaxID=695939 RepID=A0A1W1VR17_9DEIO|nr:DUF1697 domain-containing protein [Deinococcus hopiensis]SMB95815.1 Uncharacterized conserved protein, DUF1697 family [Deinococcus hopiensis KR-140]